MYIYIYFSVCADMCGPLLKDFLDYVKKPITIQRNPLL